MSHDIPFKGVERLRSAPPGGGVNAEVVAYFQRLGYQVDWDRSRRLGESWHEIMKGRKLVAQIDHGVPLSAIREDMIAWSEGRDSTSGVDYKVSAEETEDWKELLRKVRETEP